MHIKTLKYQQAKHAPDWLLVDQGITWTVTAILWLMLLLCYNLCQVCRLLGLFPIFACSSNFQLRNVTFLISVLKRINREDLNVVTETDPLSLFSIQT